MNSADARVCEDERTRGARVRSNPLLAIARLAVFTAWTSYCYAAYLVSRLLVPTAAEKRARAVTWTHRWLHRGIGLLGIRATLRGVVPQFPALITPNHLGYLDILAMGSVCPVVFVSKADVRAWPVVGHLFNVSEHIGITRSDRRGLAGVNAAISERLADGLSVCVFLEGTSSGGDGLLPFHASLIQPAVDTGVPIVPVAMKWESDDERVQVSEDVAYWRPEHAFAPHAWRLLGLRGVKVTLNFGEAFASAASDRKALAARARQRVLHLLESAKDAN